MRRKLRICVSLEDDDFDFKGENYFYIVIAIGILLIGRFLCFLFEKWAGYFKIFISMLDLLLGAQNLSPTSSREIPPTFILYF